MIKYTNEELLQRLKQLLDKYDIIQTQLIDKEPNFPNRKCFIRAFGSIENACNQIGYYEYKKHVFNIIDAQKVLDQRNNNFDLLNFNGMRNKNLTRCRTCGYEWEVITDNLARNDTASHGCPNCSHHITEYKIIVDEIAVQYTIEELIKKYPRQQNYGYVYKITNIINNKKYIGSTVSPYERWRSHIHASHDENNQCYNYPLQKGIRKYGLDNFAFEVVKENILIEDLKNVEREMIIYYNSLTNTGWGYNQTLDTECSIRGMSEKQRKATCALVDKHDNILSTFVSYHDASLKVFGVNTKFSNIRRVCKGERKAILGYIFRDIDKDGNVILPKLKNKK